MTDNPLNHARPQEVEGGEPGEVKVMQAPDAGLILIRRVRGEQLEPVVRVNVDEALDSGDPIGYAIAAWQAAQDEATPPPASPEERFQAAHEALENAVREYVAAANADQPTLLVDWVLVTAGHGDLGDGRSTTTHNMAGPVEGAAYRALGLLNYASAYVQRRYADGESE